MARRKKIYEGKAKILYEGPEPGTLVQYFKDEGAAGPTATEGENLAPEGKGLASECGDIAAGGNSRIDRASVYRWC